MWMLCFLIRGHLPLLMVCSTRRRTGTTAMVTTGDSTARGVMDSDLQVGAHLLSLPGVINDGSCGCVSDQQSCLKLMSHTSGPISLKYL